MIINGFVFVYYFGLYSGKIKSTETPLKVLTKLDKRKKKDFVI